MEEGKRDYDAVNTVVLSTVVLLCLLLIMRRKSKAKQKVQHKKSKRSKGMGNKRALSWNSQLNKETPT